MRITRYDYNHGAYENIKSQMLATRLAQNRWGTTFKKLYMRHMEPTEDETIGKYNFTKGMRGLVQSIPQAQSDLDAAQRFRADIARHFQVDTGDGFRIDGALQRSYASVLIEAKHESLVPSGIPRAEVIGVHFSLSLEDGKSWFHSSGLDEGIVCIDYESETDTGERHNTILQSRGVEERENPAFAANQEEHFEAIWSELKTFLGYMTADFVPSTAWGHRAVVVSLPSLIDFVEHYISLLQGAIEDIENGESRATEDVELIHLLGIEETLSAEISQPNKIKDIYFLFEKEIHPPATESEEEDASYAWWEEEQFQGREEGGVYLPGIADEVKNFQVYCVRDGNKVRVKRELFEHVGYKIYWFVNAFLDIDVSVKKGSLLRRIFDFVLLIVSIVLTAVSSNPMWLKIVLITTSVMGYAGVLPPEFALAVAVVSFGYGLSSVDFSSMGGMQLFSWTIKNIEMVGKMLHLYDEIGIRKEIEQKAQEKNRNRSDVQRQEDAMAFIYSRAYSQYDDLYAVLYDFSPTYQHF